MAYARRVYRKKRRPYKRKAKSKAIVQVVKRVLHSQIENKQAFKLQAGNRVLSSFPTSILGGMYSCIPNTSSALSGDNSKVGQTIQPLSLRLSATCYLQDLGGQSAANVYFDMYVFKIKKIKDSALYDSVGQVEVGQFLRPSQLGGDTLYSGRCYNYFQNVNQDVIQLIHKKRFKMAPTNLSNPSNLNGNWNDNYVQTSFYTTVPLSKHLPKSLKYTSTADDTPNNCAIFACMVSTPANATQNDANPANYFGTVDFNSCMVYEDA